MSSIKREKLDEVLAAFYVVGVGLRGFLNEISLVISRILLISDAG